MRTISGYELKCHYNRTLFALNHLFSPLANRQYHYEQKLQSILWKVDIREVTFLGTEYNGDEAFRIGNIQQFFRHRTMSLIAGESSRRAYTTIGKYFYFKAIFRR